MSQLVVVVDDLIFESRIRAAATTAGRTLVVVRTKERLAEVLQGLDEGAFVLVDLELMGSDPVEAVSAAASASPRPRIVAWGSHVQVDRLAAAREAGADEVLARSAFVARLPALVAGIQA